VLDVLKEEAMRRSNQRGQSLVEGALVLTGLLTMILFVLDMGRVMLLGQYVTERARVTARTATVNNWTERQVQNYLAYGRTTAADESADKPGFMGIKPSQVDFNVLGTQRNGDLRVQVKVEGIQALMFVPYLASQYRFPTVTVELPAQSLGATN
jgi:hypothetical protein